MSPTTRTGVSVNDALDGMESNFTGACAASDVSRAHVNVQYMSLLDIVAIKRLGKGLQLTASDGGRNFISKLSLPTLKTIPKASNAPKCARLLLYVGRERDSQYSRFTVEQ